MFSTGLWHDSTHRYWWADSAGTVGPIPSVTTILDSLAKPDLVWWYAGTTAEAAVLRRDDWLSVLKLSDDAAIAALKTVANTIRKEAGSLGSRIHALAELVFTGSDVVTTEVEEPYVRNLGRFLDDYRPEFIRIEAQVANLTHDYAGTLDFIARINGKVVLGDIKTSKGIYAEHAAQLAAYANAEFMGWPDDDTKYPLPPIEGHVVLHVRPDGYQVIPMDVTGAFEAFLGLRAVYGWQQSGAKRAVGVPLTPRVEVAA